MTPVFSTCVEVILKPFSWLCKACSILHVCGGDPHQFVQISTAYPYSPRVWRWSPDSNLEPSHLPVFSTCVEVILSLAQIVLTTNSILHVCGGDPNSINFANRRVKYSPRVWRWSSFLALSIWQLAVFSTCVEVILDVPFLTVHPGSILHVCGGDPFNFKTFFMV